MDSLLCAPSLHRLASWILVGGLVALALNPRLTLWGLTELKKEVLAQVAASSSSA